ncbi:MAG: hypothetical protein IPM79_20735 [Polyangiaceae bacterium]|nr:hypothetical protein [Polyangiaceae bacterium]
MSASASASAAAGADAPPADPKTLPATKGFLFVKVDGEGSIFTTGGKRLGDANAWLEVPCNGGKGPYVAVAKKGSNAPRGGKIVPVACQSSATVEFTAAEMNAPAPAPGPAPPPAIPVQPGVTPPPPPPPPPVNPQEP